MQRLRDDFFAGPVLSGDDHVGIGRSNAGNRLQNGLHCRRSCNHLGKALCRRKRFSASSRSALRIA